MNAETAAPTILRPKQARSRARRAALIAYGMELLERCEPDEFSIAEITADLGFSTGSFYSYFKDKEAYFIAIQQAVNEDLQQDFDATFDPALIADLPPVARFDVGIQFTLRYFRRRTGAVRSALRYERRIPQGWAPNRERTRIVIAASTEGLNDQDAEKLQTALQLAFGLMVNALLHDPGPLRLNDSQLHKKITTALNPYLSDKKTK